MKNISKLPYIVAFASGIFGLIATMNNTGLLLTIGCTWGLIVHFVINLYEGEL